MDFSELLVLMVIALILFGPEDLPKIARAMGKAVHAIRTLAQEFTRELQNAAADPVNAVNKAMEYKSEDTSNEKPDQELLVYEEDPLAELPQDMVSYQEEGVSR